MVPNDQNKQMSKIELDAWKQAMDSLEPEGRRVAEKGGKKE